MHVELYGLTGTGEQELKGTIRLEGGQLVPDPDTPPLRELLERPVPRWGEKGGIVGRIHAHADPEAFLRALHRQYSGSYFRASQVIE